MLELINRTPLCAAIHPGQSRDGRPQYTLAVKATFSFDLQGRITLKRQQPGLISRDRYRNDPQTSSLIAARETVPFKHNGEYYLYGSAYPERHNANSTRVSVSLRSSRFHCHKTLLVLGEHHWEKHWQGRRRGQPGKFLMQPLDYEWAYGGSHRDSGRREDHNPAGRGFNPTGFGLTDSRAPCIEYPDNSAVEPGKRIQPAGFGPIAEHWSPRQQRKMAQASNEADSQQAYHCQRYNYAPDDQQWPTTFCGGEQLTLGGFFPGPRRQVSLQLPLLPVSAELLESQVIRALDPTCDTLVINTDEQEISLLWRAPLPRPLLAMSQVILHPLPGHPSVHSQPAKQTPLLALSACARR